MLQRNGDVIILDGDSQHASILSQNMKKYGQIFNLN